MDNVPPSASQDRLILLEALGGMCVRCGIEDYRTLQIDHKAGFTGKTRKTISLKKMLQQLQLYQILCANCNWIKKHDNGEHPGTVTQTNRQQARLGIANFVLSSSRSR